LQNGHHLGQSEMIWVHMVDVIVIFFLLYITTINPDMVISYQLFEYSNVELKFYNSLGQEVKTLVNKLNTLGECSVKWKIILLK